MEHPTTELIAYLQGELGAGERQRVDAHLAGCRACRDERDAFAEILESLRASAPAAPPIDSARWRAELRRRLETPPGRRAGWLRPVPVGLSLGLAGALLVVAWLGGERPAPRSDRPAMEDVLLEDRVENLRQSSLLEGLDLMEDLEVIHQLDRLAPRGDG